MHQSAVSLVHVSLAPWAQHSLWALTKAICCSWGLRARPWNVVMTPTITPQAPPEQYHHSTTLQSFLINVIIPWLRVTPTILSWLITRHTLYMNPSRKTTQWFYGTLFVVIYRWESWDKIKQRTFPKILVSSLWGRLYETRQNSAKSMCPTAHWTC